MELVKEHFPIYYNGMMEYEDGLFLSYGSVDGVQYGLPTLATGNLFHLPIVYNETWMKAVGVEKTPETLDELHDLLWKFTYEDPDGDGVQNTYGISSDAMRLVFGAYGVNPGAADGRTDHSAFQFLDDDHDGTNEFVYSATSKRYQEALKVLKTWYDEGIIDPEFITGENTGGYWAISHSMVNHRIGCTVRGNYYHWVSKGDYQYIGEDGSMVDVDSGAVATEFLNANPTEKLTFGAPGTAPAIPTRFRNTAKTCTAKKASTGIGRIRKPASGPPLSSTRTIIRNSKPSIALAALSSVPARPASLFPPPRSSPPAWAIRSMASAPCCSSPCP